MDGTKLRKTATAAAAAAIEAAPAAAATDTAAAAAPRAAGAAQATSAGLSQALAAAIDLLRNEQVEQAEPALEAILKRWPDQPDALHYLGVLRHTQGRIDEAVALIRRALAAMPELPGAWNNLGNVLLLAGRGNEAAQAYEQAVRFGTDARTAPEAVRALNNLGVLHRRLHRMGESELALREAIARDPEFADAWYNLSITLIHLGRVPEGLKAHAKAVALWPEEVQSQQEIIRALTRLGEYDRAARLLRDWLEKDPGNAVAEHMLAACRANASSETAAVAPARASDQYVQEVFDSFAASFDAKLEALNYRAPELVIGALREAVGAPAGTLDIVDAGCGTGLCGPGLKPFARRLAGCDLSAGMLRRAKARALYDVLHQAELMHYLRTQPQAFDAVVSADTLCYFGALGEALAAAHRSLQDGGVLVFTVEALPEGRAEAHRLQANGRYAHSPAHLRAALAGAGFELSAMRAQALRMEGGEPVPGWLVTALKPATGGATQSATQGEARGSTGGAA